MFGRRLPLSRPELLSAGVLTPDLKRRIDALVLAQTRPETRMRTTTAARDLRALRGIDIGRLARDISAAHRAAMRTRFRLASKPYGGTKAGLVADEMAKALRGIDLNRFVRELRAAQTAQSFRTADYLSGDWMPSVAGPAVDLDVSELEAVDDPGLWPLGWYLRLPLYGRIMVLIAALGTLQLLAEWVVLVASENELPKEATLGAEALLKGAEVGLLVWSLHAESKR